MKNSFLKTLFVTVLFISIQQHINSQPKSIGIGKNSMYYGASYYPEAWDASLISADIRRMKELHMNVMRMAEFSWSLMEPADGYFNFDWLKIILDSLHANNIDVILGTPTATPPAWLGTKYPEIYRTEENGLQLMHGARRNCSYTNAVYKKYSERIVLKMSEKLGKHPALIAWQTDNEFNHEADFSHETTMIWHQWLKNRYGSISNLNALWCTQLWSQTYDSFAQVPMPVKAIWSHPSLLFNWNRFINDMIVEFQDIQIRAIRKYSILPITHDGMPGQAVDYEKLFANLDYMAVNNYHSFEAYDLIQSNYDRMRGYNKGAFWLFETAPNYSGGGAQGNTWFLHQPDGSLRAALWMNYALGAQGAMFWLWRQHWAGQEMVHGSVLSAWGKPAANYDDIKSIGIELSKFSDKLVSAPVVPAKIAIVWSHENLIGLRMEEYANGLSYYKDWTYRFYRPIADAYLHRDVINQSADISSYKVIFVPLLPYLSEAFSSKLKKWVAEGGTLILGPMTAYRSTEWTAFTDQALGYTGNWMGVEVDSRIPIGTNSRPSEIPLQMNFTDKTIADAAIAGLWSESLSSQKGKIIALYNNGMHKNKAAIIENTIGTGRVVVLGTDPGKIAIANLIKQYAAHYNIFPLIDAEPGLVVAPRGTNRDDLSLVLVNISNKLIKVNKTAYTKDILNSDKQTSATFIMAPYQVMWLKK